MAEYRNGLNYRGQMAVEKKDVNSDVQTGRAVFVDEDKYEKDADYKAKVDKCIEQGFHRVSGDGSGGSSGGRGTEPLIVSFDHKETDGGVKYIFDKTWQDVRDAINSNRAAYIKPYFVDEDEIGLAESAMCPVLTTINGVGQLRFTVFSIYSGVVNNGVVAPLYLYADGANGYLYNETGSVE